MKPKSFLLVLLAAAVISWGLVLAEDEEKPAPSGEAALEKVLENQEKILQKLDKIQEDLLFIKNKTARL